MAQEKRTYTQQANIRWLEQMIRRCREEDVKPRLHPNGFIQLNLDNTNLSLESGHKGGAEQRLHVWPGSPLPAQKTRHPVHDHTFGFSSTCYLGSLLNITYTFRPRMVGQGTRYYLYAAVPLEGEDTELVRWSRGGDLFELGREQVRPGDVYTLDAFVLHESIPDGRTATVMTKLSKHEGERPMVAVPAGVWPDNDFRRDQVALPLLWLEIYKALKEITGE